MPARVNDACSAARHSNGGRLALLGALLALAFPASAIETLTYTLAPEFDRGVTRVELVWRTEGRSRSVLRVAERWGQIDNVLALLSDLNVMGATFRREGSLFVLSHPPGGEVTVRYAISPGVSAFSDWKHSHHPITTDTFFHGIGNAFLLTPNVGSGMPAEYETLLRWRLPAGADAVCSWGAGRNLGARLRVDDLRESVYLAGKLKTRRVREDGREVFVALVDRFKFSLDDFAKMTTEIVRRQAAFMNDTRFPDFVVTAIPVGEPLREGESRLAGSGLFRSFALMVAPGAELTDAVEHLFAHELFHQWNGRLLQAAQPERLAYWFVEGVTDYYALRILFDSGYWDARTYAKWINKHLREYARNPAQSATNADIERDYWRQRGTVGEVAYQRGLLLGLRWHRLAQSRGVSSGLDTLLHGMLRRARTGPFLVSNETIRHEGVRTLGGWFGQEFDRYVLRAEPVDVPEDALAPRFTGAVRTVHDLDLGFDYARSLEKRVVRGVTAGSSAEKAGLRDGDELSGWSIHGDADRKIELKVKRNGRTRDVSYYPRGTARRVMQFEPVRGAASGKAGEPG